MDRVHVIALDTHCAFTELAIFSAGGRRVSGRRVATTIPNLRQAIERVRRPRHVVLEEGPLADWLVRELRGSAERVVACDPRRNAHIAKDGDKDDAIDAAKLGRLYRGGFVNAVHHPESCERSCFKQLVGVYHDRVRQAVRQANRILAQFRRHGAFASQADLGDARRRRELLAAVPWEPLRAGVRVQLAAFDRARRDVARVRRLVVHESREHEALQRFTEVPGVKWIRAATFFVYVDTPWRFRSKQALWRYMGIGLQRRHSGQGQVRVGVPKSVEVCRPLKGMILGAAKSAMAGRNPFAAQYKEWRDAGVSPRNACRNVARSQAATLWGMFKNGAVYQPERVGLAAAAVPAEARLAVDGRIERGAQSPGWQ